MSGWMLLEEAGDDILLYPAVGKLVGSYPASYRNERGEEAVSYTHLLLAVTLQGPTEDLPHYLRRLRVHQELSLIHI